MPCVAISGAVAVLVVRPDGRRDVLYVHPESHLANDNDSCQLALLFSFSGLCAADPPHPKPARCSSLQVRERVINVSSISSSSRMDWGNLEGEQRYSAEAQYETSKARSKTPRLQFHIPVLQLLRFDCSTVHPWRPAIGTSTPFLCHASLCGLDLLL